MKKETTSMRLKKIMNDCNLRQVDILEKARSYCKKYGTKLTKSDLSQYVSGAVEPGQDKLTILGKALNVSEAWLMGFDVPMERDATTGGKLSTKQVTLLSSFDKLNDKGQQEAIKRVDELAYMDKYSKDNIIQMVAEEKAGYLAVNAARPLKDAAEEDRQHDNDIMDDPNF